MKYIRKRVQIAETAVFIDAFKEFYRFARYLNEIYINERKEQENSKEDIIFLNKLYKRMNNKRHMKTFLLDGFHNEKRFRSRTISREKKSELIKRYVGRYFRQYLRYMIDLDIIDILRI